ncbi:MAG TPA: hypothetical protein VEI02_15195 [Planctomycetota bacterium]|nr:hypothetical protein [Planctomycetota bacterium]
MIDRDGFGFSAAPNHGAVRVRWDELVGLSYSRDNASDWPRGFLRLYQDACGKTRRYDLESTSPLFIALVEVLRDVLDIAPATACAPARVWPPRRGPNREAVRVSFGQDPNVARFLSGARFDEGIARAVARLSNETAALARGVRSLRRTCAYLLIGAVALGIAAAIFYGSGR